MRFVVEIGKYKNLVLCVNLNEKGEKGSFCSARKDSGGSGGEESFDEREVSGSQNGSRDGITKEQFRELKLLVGGLALSKFRGASRHAIDSICITAFVSLTMTAIYSNYFLILGAVISLSGILCNAMQASVGNSIVTESREKTYRDMRRFNFMHMLAAGWAMVCLLYLYQPFVQLWVGPSLMLGMPEVVALCLYFYLLKAGDMRWIYHQGAGLWWKARYIVIAEIVCNIVLNILLAKYWGVLGIILATLISLFFVNFLGGAWILFKEYFKNGKLHEFFADQALYFGVTAVLAVVCFYVCDATLNVGGERWDECVDGRPAFRGKRCGE